MIEAEDGTKSLSVSLLKLIKFDKEGIWQQKVEPIEPEEESDEQSPEPEPA